MESVLAIKKSSVFAQKMSDYAALTKFKLSFTVMISAALGFGFGASFSNFEWIKFLLFCVGSMLITCAANIINEVIEKDTDKLMLRTMNRPLPASTMSMTEAILLAGLMGVGGILLMLFEFSALAAVLSALSLLSYAFIYTPLKKISSVSVFVGAIPGALPPAIGYICATQNSEINYFVAVILFSIQFLWQFPHFWSIAWIRFDEYTAAGFKMLPSESGKTSMSAIHTVVYSAALLAVSVLPYFLGMMNLICAGVVTICGVVFLWLSIQFYRKCDDASARKLMFASFAYLPLVQLAMVLGRINL